MKAEESVPFAVRVPHGTNEKFHRLKAWKTIKEGHRLTLGELMVRLIDEEFVRIGVEHSFGEGMKDG